MEKEQISQFQRVLEVLLADMQWPSQTRDEIAIESAADALDQVQQGEERDLAIRRIESTFSRIQSIKLALDRINAGEYGTCLRCEGEISAKRLQAIPWAGYCIRCQEAVDWDSQQPGGGRFDSLLQRSEA
jgi:DnaK suppressor protein